MAPREMAYVNPGSCIAVAVLFAVLSILAVSGRIYSRRLMHNDFGIDDYLCFVATMLLVACSADITVGVVLETVGYHSTPSWPEFGSPRIIKIEKVQWSYQQIWMMAATLIKLSWLCLYRRIFRGKVFTIVNYTAISLVLGWGIGSFLVNLFTCGVQFDKNWTDVPVFLLPQCINSIHFKLVNASLGCILDTIILIIPMPVIWQLNMPVKSRIALIGLFAVGVCCVIASAILVALMARICEAVGMLSPGLSIMGLRGDDNFGVISVSLFWSQIELGVAIVASCLPFTKSIVTEAPLLSGLRSKSSSSEDNSHTNKLQLRGEHPRQIHATIPANVASLDEDGINRLSDKSWHEWV